MGGLMASKITSAERVAFWALERSKTGNGQEIAAGVMKTFTRTSVVRMIDGVGMASHSLASKDRERARRLVSAEALLREMLHSHAGKRRGN